MVENEDIKDEILKTFDKQIRWEYKRAGGDRRKCPSYWSKLLFLETLDLDMSDWRKIRSDDYWEISDSLKGIEKSKFTLERVRSYLRI